MHAKNITCDKLLLLLLPGSSSTPATFLLFPHACNEQRFFPEETQEEIYRNASSLFEGIFNLSPPFFYMRQTKGRHSIIWILLLHWSLSCVRWAAATPRKERCNFLFVFFLGGGEGVGALLREGESWCGQNGAIRVLTEEGLDFHFSLEEVVFCPRPRKIIFIPEEKEKFF